MAQDYTSKLSVDPAAVAAAFQRKAAEEQQMQQAQKQQSESQFANTIAQATNLVSTSVAASKEKQKSDFIKSLAENMANDLSTQQQADTAQTFPKPVSSMVPSTFTVAQPLQPTAEGNSIKALAATNPADFTKQIGQTVLQTPQEKLANTVKGLTVQKDLQSLKEDQAPMSKPTSYLISRAYQKLGQPMPDLTGMTNKDAHTHLKEVMDQVEKQKTDVNFGEKQQQFDENKLLKFNDVTNYEKSARGASGQAAQAVRGIGQLKQLFDGYKNDLTPQEWEEAATAWNRILSSGGGSSSREGVKALIPNTAQGNIKKTMQWFTNNPTGTNQQKFAERMQQGMAREEAFNNQYLTKKTVEQIGAFVPTFMRRDPAEVQQLLESKGITHADVAKKYPGLAKHVWGSDKVASSERPPLDSFFK